MSAERGGVILFSWGMYGDEGVTAYRQGTGELIGWFPSAAEAWIKLTAAGEDVSDETKARGGSGAGTEPEAPFRPA